VRLRIVLAACSLATLCSAASADDALAPTLERARLHYQAGEKLYLLGRYEDALREFQDGYAIAPKPEFLLNLGQVHRKLGNREQAVEMFEKFLLSTTPDDPRRAAVEDVLAELRTEMSTAAAPTVTAITTTRTVTVAPARHWYQDWIGDTLTGAGVVGVGVGAALFLSANSTIGDAPMDLQHYVDARDAHTTRTVGASLLAAGGALVIAGIIRYVTYEP
jgi:tetratricopeptide (TPR) repeat protein